MKKDKYRDDRIDGLAGKKIAHPENDSVRIMMVGGLLVGIIVAIIIWGQLNSSKKNQADQAKTSQLMLDVKNDLQALSAELDNIKLWQKRLELMDDDLQNEPANREAYRLLTKPNALENVNDIVQLKLLMKLGAFQQYQQDSALSAFSKGGGEFDSLLRNMENLTNSTQFRLDSLSTILEIKM